MKNFIWAFAPILLGTTIGLAMGEIVDARNARQAVIDRQVVETCKARDAYAVKGVDGTYGCVALK